MLEIGINFKFLKYSSIYKIFKQAVVILLYFFLTFEIYNILLNKSFMCHIDYRDVIIKKLNTDF